MIPFGMDCFLPMAYGIVIHDIIVYQGKIMKQFYCQSHVHQCIRIHIVGPSCKVDQDRPESFSFSF
ncbi:uncharacterized protein METZ01_LOCUS75263 [marine metagenome]|uniref:Uncharacterized protein n=1 Tax=marine metagenome TaxID=408172 RepID=A0A381U2T3_9ZZZZ